MTKVDEIARIAHEVNRAYCESIGDESQPEWDEAPGWQKASAISGVYFHIHNRDASVNASHENWMNDKLKDGWTYGTEKEPDEKRHPCMVPFKDLPQEQRSKDYLFRAIVRALDNDRS